jgi:hypothetical protein
LLARDVGFNGRDESRFPKGLEPLQDSPGKPTVPASGDAQSDAIADLLAAIEALSPAQRAELLRKLTGK